MNLLILAFLITIAVCLGYIGLKLRARFSHLDAKLERLENGTRKELREEFHRGLDERSVEIQNAIALQALGISYPTFLADWSLDSFLGRFLMQHLMEAHPKVIVELGSGSSTILIAKAMKTLGHEHEHLAIDHDKRFLNITKQLAEANHVSDGIQFFECPLAELEGSENSWYQNVVDKIADKKIDLLIVDGPPAVTQPWARYPALPQLHEHLSPQCVVILDDAVREGERKIAKQWCELYPEFQLEFLNRAHGAAILRRQQVSPD